MVKFIKISQKKEFQEANMESIEMLYKHCGFRKDDFFEKIKNIDLKNGSIEIYGKISGRLCNKNIINILDNEIIGYGTLGLIYNIKNKYQDLTNEIYEKLINKYENNETFINSNLSLLKKNESNSESDEESSEESDDESDNESDNEFLNPELEPDSYLYTSDEEILDN